MVSPFTLHYMLTYRLANATVQVHASQAIAAVQPATTVSSMAELHHF
jgi:hypothetical protein